MHHPVAIWDIGNGISVSSLLISLVGCVKSEHVKLGSEFKLNNVVFQAPPTEIFLVLSCFPCSTSQARNLEFYLPSFHTHFLKLLHEQGQPVGERERNKGKRTLPYLLGTIPLLSG